MDKLEKIKELGEKGKVSKLVKLTQDRDVDIAAAAFEALGNCDTQESRETLQNAIRDPEPKIRMAIAKSFQKIGDDHISEALHHQFLKETDPALKAEFEKALDFCRGRRFGG